MLVEVLLAALEDKDASVRKDVVQKLGKTNDRRAVDPLIAALKDPDAEVERVAADSLGDLGDPRAIGPLLGTIVSANPSVDTTAGDALGQFKDQRIVTRLIAILEDERIRALPIGNYIQSAAIFALGEEGDPQAIGPLLETMKREPHSNLVLDCGKALGKMGSPGGEALIPLVNDPEKGVRWSAYQALAQTRNPLALDVMLAALKSSDWVVYPVAADFVARSDDPRALPALLAAMSEPRHGVNSEAAAIALGQAGSKAVEPLAALLRGPDARARRYAAPANSRSTVSSSNRHASGSAALTTSLNSSLNSVEPAPTVNNRARRGRESKSSRPRSSSSAAPR